MNILQPIAIIVGVVSGVSGLVLGVLNYWHQRVSTRPRLVVRPYILSESDSNVQYVGYIEVYNVGNVAVVGGSAGFLYKTHINQFTSDTWTDCPLLPQHVAILRVEPKDLPKNEEPDEAFVWTIVGDKFKANRHYMQQFRRHLTRLQ
jgi:hypothetical protein